MLSHHIDPLLKAEKIKDIKAYISTLPEQKTMFFNRSEVEKEKERRGIIKAANALIDALETGKDIRSLSKEEYPGLYRGKLGEIYQALLEAPEQKKENNYSPKFDS